MADLGKIHFDGPGMATFLRNVCDLRGEAYAAQWLSDEVQKQPVAFLRFVIGLSEPSAAPPPQENAGT
jgi:hypothetical protein